MTDEHRERMNTSSDAEQRRRDIAALRDGSNFTQSGGIPPEAFVLGVDLDGVCADYTAAFRHVVAEELGVAPAELGEQQRWDFSEWGVRDRAHFLELHERAVIEQRLFATMPAIEGAADALWRLSDEHGVWIRIITHRLHIKGGHHVAVSDTVQWLDEHNIPFRDICFLGAKPQVGAGLYIDDSPSNIASLRDAGCSTVVFDQPYNRDVDGDRVTSWDECERYVAEAVARWRDSESL